MVVWRTSLWLLLGVLGSSASGCAAPGAPAPADYPSHATQDFAAVHWRLDRQDGAVTATGLIEVIQFDRVAQVRVELQSADASGRVLVRGSDYARPRSFSGREPWPFTIRVTASGPDDRFTVRVTEVTFKVERPGGR